MDKNLALLAGCVYGVLCYIDKPVAEVELTSDGILHFLSVDAEICEGQEGWSFKFGQELRYDFEFSFEVIKSELPNGGWRVPDDKIAEVYLAALTCMQGPFGIQIGGHPCPTWLTIHSDEDDDTSITPLTTDLDLALRFKTVGEAETQLKVASKSYAGDSERFGFLICQLSNAEMIAKAAVSSMPNIKPRLWVALVEHSEVRGEKAAVFYQALEPDSDAIKHRFHKIADPDELEVIAVLDISLSESIDPCTRNALLAYRSQ